MIKKRYEDEPAVKPLNHHHNFDFLMGTMLSSIDVKSPTKLADTKNALLKICGHVYKQLREEVILLNVDNENKAARYCLGLMREKYAAWRKKIKSIEAWKG